MVRLGDLNDDHYVFDKEEFAVIGNRTHNVYRLGDEVYVKVKNADLVKKHLQHVQNKKKHERTSRTFFFH